MKLILRNREIIAAENSALNAVSNVKISTLFLLLSFQLFLGLSGFTQANYQFSFNRIPFSDPEIISPMRGAEIWHDEYGPNIINNISESVYQRPLDVYVRSTLTWDKLETSRGVYDFSVIDQYFRDAIPKKQKVGICVLTQWPDRDLSGVSYDGYVSSYPEYVHDLMQSEATNSRDYVRSNTWVPNYNSPNYLARYEALMLAIANHINTTSYQGVPYRYVLSYVDMGGYGSWGEWNQVGIHDDPSDYPAGRQPTYQSLNRIIDAHITAFPDHQILMNSLALDGRTYPNVWVPVETGYHALTVSNRFGKLGISKKSWGWPSSWFTSQILDESPHVYNGMRFDTAAANRWKYAPIHGEGPGGGTSVSDDENGYNNSVFMGLLPNQVRRFHISMVGNGNFGGEHNQGVRGRDSLRLAWKTMGYRIELEAGQMTSVVAPGQPMSITLNWRNVGVAPVYELWDVTYELQNQTTKAVVWSGNSRHQLKGWLPAATATVVTDNFTVPAGLPTATYQLVLKIKDRVNYRDPLPLAIRGRQTDGSYILRTNIAYNSSGVVNATPTANAGADQVITLPVNTTTLNGSGTDTDGTIGSYAWTKVSGPAGGAISSANTASTGITGLTAGVYVFRLTVTDNGGAIATNDIQVTVNSAPLPPNQAPTANAGADQVITLPVNTTTLNGSGTDPDGTIASFAWAKVSGPAGGTITSANTASTGISGLVAGVYVFRLTVTDNSGTTATNTIQVTVNSAPAPAPNAAPTANAGTDRNITLPVNSTTVNGSGTDTDGTIASFAWTKVSGPAGGNLQSPAAASTNITGLNAGTYVFRLTVTDNDGATATDNVSVIVSASLAPSPSNQAPVANAGNNITITLPVNNASLAGSGTDADGSIATYSWTKVSGPTGGNVQSTNTASTNITSLIAGTYVFRLTVTDNAGAQSTDDVQITVNPAPAPVGNQAPIANAGTNRSITLPTNSASFTGSGTDPDGTIAGYSWTKVSGPAGGAIQTPNAATTNITGLTAGTYVFRLTVTDNDGATSTDDIQLIVNAAPVLPNQAPIANAGRDISITLPVNSTMLNGSASTDPDGSIVSYSWRKVQGPNGSSLTANNTVSANASDLTKGVHEYELTVTDNRGGTATDRVLVTVIKINQRPLALTTRDTINVALPVQNTELNAASSYDPDGTISNYQWTYTRGPKEPKVLAPTASKTVVTDLIAGTYSFNLVVTDNDGDKTSKSVVVIVSNSSSRRQVPDVSIYPNPATGLVNVKINTPVEGRTTLTFVDMNGRPVLTDSFVKGFSTFTRQVNISSLPKGTYAIIIQVDQTEKVVEKVIKF